MNKRNNWFNNYENIRDLDYRKNNLFKEDFENLSVIDIGCNSGQMTRYASDLGAKYIVYFDYRVLDYLKNDNIHSLFILNYDIKERFNNRPALELTYNKSYSIDNFIKNIYHIIQY